MAEYKGQLISEKYRLLAVLGEGAMGMVYRAEQLDAEGQPLREVALKVVQPAFSRDPDFARRFLREVRVTAQLRSPHTVTVHDTGQTEQGQFYYAMELVRGSTLKDLLQRQGSLPVARVVHIVGQVCDALAEAHGQLEPVVHRDLKPANIFVEERQGQDWVKVGDFGIAKIIGEHTSGLTHTGASPGTPKYMAPEQWMGKAVDGRADLYALGIMLYELLTGRAPFSGGEGPLALMYQHLHEPPPLLPPAIPQGIRVLVERLLAKASQGRPATALQVRQMLAAALTGEVEGGTQSTILPDDNQNATPAEAEGGTEGKHLLVEAGQETLAPKTVIQPATVIQPRARAVSTRTRPSRRAPWRYGAAGGLLVLAVMLGARWYYSPQQADETQQPSAVEQGVAEQQIQLPQAESRQAAPSQEPSSQLQAKAEPPEAVGQVQQEAEERKQAETTQRVAELLARADKQKAAKQLTTPAGDNAVETYRELLRIAPRHAKALAGLQDIKGQYRQLGDAAQQGGEWAKAQGHYEKALKIDPQDETLTAALQQVKAARKQAEAVAGWYQTTVSTPVLKEPRQNAPVITNLSPQKRVYVAGAVGDYVRIESVRGNPPGYIARKNVTRPKEGQRPQERLSRRRLKNQQPTQRREERFLL